MRLFALPLAALLACAPAPDSVEDAGGDTDDTTDEIGDERDPSCSAEYGWLTTITGEVHDEAGAGLDEVRIQSCINLAPSNTLLCIQPAVSAADGSFTLTVPQEARCMIKAVLRVVRPSSNFGSLYCPLELPESGGTVSLDEPLTLFDTTAATTLPPRGDADASRVVVFDSGIELDVVPADFMGGGAGYEGLAARLLAPSTSTCVLGGAPSLTGVVAFSPEGEVLDDGYVVRVPNTHGLAAGVDVGMWVLGGIGCALPDDTHVPEGVWQDVGTGAVSGDGLTVELPALPCLTWMGYAPR